jgi:nucleoside-diphosphate-sugar epimerase
MNKKICVIGGSGFIGTRLIEHINNYFSIKIVDKRPSEKFNEITTICDIRNQDTLNRSVKGCEYIVHLAAEHRDDVSPISLYYDVNVQGTKNVLEAMIKNGINNIIFTSSVAVYGLNKPNPNENFQTDPFNDYGKSKWQAEEILRKWYNENPSQRNLTIIRPTVVFGEKNRGNVYNLLKQIASGKFMMVGNGKNKKSMAYVGNIAAFIDYCLQNMKGYQVYNYIDKPDFTMNDLVNQVEISMGRKMPKVRLPKWLGMIGGYLFDGLGIISGKKFSISSVRVKKFCATTQFDATKAHSSGFKAPYTLSEGLHKTLQFEFLQRHEGDRKLLKSE